MAVNKVVYSGNTLIDLTNDTVTADTLSEGVTAHGADGRQITGTQTAVQYGKVQSLTDAQKAQARENIGAAEAEALRLLAEEVSKLPQGGASLSVDADGNATLTGAVLSVDNDGNATI